MVMFVVISFLPPECMPAFCHKSTSRCGSADLATRLPLAPTSKCLDNFSSSCLLFSFNTFPSPHLRVCQLDFRDLASCKDVQHHNLPSWAPTITKNLLYHLLAHWRPCTQLTRYSHAGTTTIPTPIPISPPLPVLDTYGSMLAAANNAKHTGICLANSICAEHRAICPASSIRPEHGTICLTTSICAEHRAVCPTSSIRVELPGTSPRRSANRIKNAHQRGI